MSLTVGLMLVVIITTIHVSFETSIDDWQSRTLRSDVVVSAMGNVVTLNIQPLAESIAADIDKIPGVDVVDGHGARGFRFVRHIHEGQQIAIKAIDPQHPRVGSALYDVTDRRADDAVRDLYAPGRRTVMVSQNFVTHFHKRTGDSVAIDTPQGRVTFESSASWSTSPTRSACCTWRATRTSSCGRTRWSPRSPSKPSPACQLPRCAPRSTTRSDSAASSR